MTFGPMFQPTNRSYTIFDQSTGKVLTVGNCDGTTFNEAYANRPDVISVPLNTETLQSYVDLNTMMVCPKLPSRVTLDGFTLTDLPVPSVIVIDGVPHENTDASVELEFDMPGTYQVVVKSITELDGAFQVIWP